MGSRPVVVNAVLTDNAPCSREAKDERKRKSISARRLSQEGKIPLAVSTLSSFHAEQQDPQAVLLFQPDCLLQCVCTVAGQLGLLGEQAS